jgi:glucosyl-dolichyl phosphate glucuronosyltransferase
LPTTLTIGISTWNRADLLRQTLETLTALRTPPGVTWDVLVCDNNSPDATRQTVEALSGRLPVRYVLEPRQGSSHARNRLISMSDACWVFFLDDDVRVEPGWLEGYLAGMARHPGAAIFGGPILPWVPQPPGAVGAFLMKTYPAVVGILEIAADTPMAAPGPTAYGANMVFRRDVLDEQAFDPRLGMVGGKRISSEEVTLMARLLAGGHTGWLLPEPGVHHYIPPAHLTARRFRQWQVGIGRTWRAQRGLPQAGKLGVPWWAWRQFARRAVRAGVRWRPWVTPGYYQALGEAAQYWGYLRG